MQLNLKLAVIAAERELLRLRGQWQHREKRGEKKSHALNDNTPRKGVARRAARR